MGFLLKFLDFYSMTNMTFQKYYIIFIILKKKLGELPCLTTLIHNYLSDSDIRVG